MSLALIVFNDQEDPKGSSLRSIIDASKDEIATSYHRSGFGRYLKGIFVVFYF
jgi:hypothetical protein